MKLFPLLLFLLLNITITTDSKAIENFEYKIISLNDSLKNGISETTLQLNFLLESFRITKDHPLEYHIVGYTHEGKIINLKRQRIAKYQMICATVDPRVRLKKIGVVLISNNERYFYIFKPKRIVNELLNVDKAKA